MAACTQKAFDGACRKCSERGHKARECRTAGIESEAAKVEEKPTRVCRKARCGTESPSRVEEVGREGEKASARAGGHKAAATTAGVSLAATTSSHEDDGDSAKARHTSVVPQEPEPASQVVADTTADAVNPNATSTGPTRPEDKSYNPPDKAQSISLEGRSVENSSCMGFIFSSLHKHGLISVVEYSSFTLVTLQFSTGMYLAY